MVEAVALGLWHALEYAGVFCVNPATSVEMWEDKLTQLVVADQVGLATPVTRYLCDLSAAADFADVHGGQIVYKPFTPYPAHHESTDTSPSSTPKSCRRASCARRWVSNLVATPGIFQPYVNKAFELRVVYVGGTILRLPHRVAAERGGGQGLATLRPGEHTPSRARARRDKLRKEDR